MARNQTYPYDRWGVAVVLAIILGIVLLPLFLFSLFLGLLSVSFLIFGVVGVVILRRKVSALKRANPDLFKGLEPEEDTTKCAVCDTALVFPFRCYYCRKHFCEEHKLPKNHHCPYAPTASYRTVLAATSIVIFVGSAILYASLVIYKFSLAWLVGVFLMGFGILLLIGRSWEERQNKRAMRLT